MKVLVTGGCGFLGSHVCEYYAAKGAKVVAYDNLTKFELSRTSYNVEKARDYNWNFLRNLGVTMIKGDVRDKSELFKSADGVDFIVHTAAQPAMTISIESPELDLTTNVLGTYNVLETARKIGAPVVNCSSIHVYGNEINHTLKEGKTRFKRKPVAIDENYPILRGRVTPLHVSKRAAELYVQTFVDMYQLPAATFRLTGMYGPRQLGCEDHGWVANFVIRTMLGLPITIYETDKQVRDILYVTDAVKAFDAFYRHCVPGIYNIGGGIKNIISIGGSLRLMEKLSGCKQNLSCQPARVGDLWYFVSNINKAKENLKWEPEVSNFDGISNLVDWTKENIGLFKGGK